MACCSDEGSCPMHASATRDGSATVGVSQADADRCCAASTKDESTPTSNGLAYAVIVGVAHSASVAVVQPAAHADLSRAFVPIPIPHVAKHLLLSVLLV